MHNLSTVFKFEVVRTLKKKSFWIVALTVPVMIGVLFGVIFFSNKATSDQAEKMKNAKFSMEITDHSGVLSPQIASAVDAKQIDNKQQGIDNVKNEKVDAYFYYPKDLTKEPIEVYGKDVSFFDNSKYGDVAQALLNQSVRKDVNPEAVAVLTDTTKIQSTTYRQGAEYNGLLQMIWPGIFLLLFYFLMTMFGGQMLTSTTDEKENRVIEMILTTVESRTLIIGKILALIVLAIIQGAIFIVPAILLYIFFHDSLSIPMIDLSVIPVDPVRIAIAAIIFAAGFLLFTGLLVAIGAAAPSAKEANSFIGVVYMMIFAPLYAFSLFISSPDATIVKVLTYFPFTAPIPALLRNAVGNLSIGEAAIVISILIVAAIIVMGVAVRLFRYGAIEYSKKLSLKTIFQK